MPPATATATATKASKPRAKAARKTSARKSTARASASRKAVSRKPARKKVTARKTAPVKPSPANRLPKRARAAPARVAQKRSGRRAPDPRRALRPGGGPSSETATRKTANVFNDYAERAVLIPVGAALLARDRVVNTVSDTFSTYSSSSKTQAQLRRFERRGLTARNRLEREVRKARVRVERELRQRRRVVENRVNDLDDRREAFLNNGSEIANRVPEIARKVQDRILSLV